MAKLKFLGGTKVETDTLDPLWSAEYEHDELDTSNKVMVRSRSYTPWFDEREDIVDFVASREGTIKKVYKREGGEIKIATAQGSMTLDQVAEIPDYKQLEQSNPEARSAEDLTLG